MIFLFFAAGIAAAFFVGSLLALQLGRGLGLRYRKQGATDAMAGLATVEGAIFGLMGLLLAFTISGALQRFDDRRQLVLQEAGAAVTGLRPSRCFRRRGGRSPAAQAQGLCAGSRGPVPHAARFPSLEKHGVFLIGATANRRQPEKKPVERSRSGMSKGQLSTRLFAGIACARKLFEVARLRAGASEKHPPQIIYFMLFGLGLGCSLLAGFGMAAAAARSWVHMVLFAGTLTDMEYPRLGLIRIESFDHFLADTLEQMH